MFINNINPILLELGFISIRWYGVFLALGVGLVILVSVNLFKKNNVQIDLVFSSSSYLIISGLIGARWLISFFVNHYSILTIPKR